MKIKEIAEKFKCYPELKARFEELLHVVENNEAKAPLAANVTQQHMPD